MMDNKNIGMSVAFAAAGALLGIIISWLFHIDEPYRIIAIGVGALLGLLAAIMTDK